MSKETRDVLTSMQNIRRFIPRQGAKTTVREWIWKRKRGLTCVYVDGLKFKSEYTLAELIATENPVEISPLARLDVLGNVAMTKEVAI